MAIPRCLKTVEEAMALIREDYAEWSALNRQTGKDVGQGVAYNVFRLRGYTEPEI
jgi:hypothetical protein